MDDPQGSAVRGTTQLLEAARDTDAAVAGKD